MHNELHDVCNQLINRPATVMYAYVHELGCMHEAAPFSARQRLT